MVLLHGVPSSGAYWLPLMRQLADHRRVVGLDLLGFGRSPRSTNGDYSLATHSAAIIATLQALDLPTPWVVVGHSFGSLLAVQLATTRPELIDRLVLTSLPAYHDSGQVIRQLARSRVSPRYVLDGIRAWVQTAMGERHSYQTLPAQSQSPLWVSPRDRSIAQFIIDQSTIQALTGLTAPVTVLNGQRDVLLRGIDHSWLDQLEHVRVQWLPGGHQLPLDHPQAVVAAITG